MTAFEHMVAILVGIVLPLSGARQRRSENVDHAPLDTRDKAVVYWGNSAFLTALCAVTLTAWLLAGRTLDEIGLTQAPRHWATGLVLAGVLLALFALDSIVQLSPARLAATKERWRRNTPFMPANARESRCALVMVFTASVFEEVVFRGFLISYLIVVLGSGTASTAAAIGLPAIAFGIAHAYQGTAASLKIAVMAAIVGAIYVVTGSLWIPIALHLVIDLAGIALGPRLLTEEDGADEQTGD